MVNFIVSYEADDLYRRSLKMILEEGNLTHPRGFDCIELSPCHLRLEKPWSNIITNADRKISKAFAAAEFMWMMSGHNDVSSISYFNKNISKYSDDGLTFFGAYGPKLVSQMGYIVEILKKDPWTRQAVLNIWRENPPETKDVPCTVMMHFLRRPANALNMIVYMRSQDAWLGLPYDLHNFTSIQILLAAVLDLNVGVFDLIQGSLHLYEPNINQAKLVINGPTAKSEVTPIELPKMIEQKILWMTEYVNKKRAV